MKKNIFTPILIIVAVLIIVGAGCFLIEDKPEPTNLNQNINQASAETIRSNYDSQDNTNLFLAYLKEYTNETEIIQLYMYNVDTGETILNKEFEPSDNLASSSYNSLYSNDSIQVNEYNGDMFYSTYGASMMTGECINDDGTCYNRIYKTNLNSQGEEIIYENENTFNQWMYNPSTDAIYLTSQSEDKAIIKKINTTTKEETVLYNSNFMEDIYSYTGYVLSADLNYVYQPYIVYEPTDYNNQILYVNKIDTATDQVHVQKIYQGDAVTGYNNVSPDGKYMSFYTEDYMKLNLYNLETEELSEILIDSKANNVQTYWSADSTKLMYALDSQLGYYNIETLTHQTITGATDYTTALMWAPSDKYLLYENEDLQIYNVEEGSRLIVPDEVKQNYSTEIKNIDWF